MAILDSEWMKALANKLVSAINSAVAMSPGSQKHLKHLEGCILLAHVKGLNLNLYLGVTTESDKSASTHDGSINYKVQFVSASEHSDVKISATPLSYLKFLSQKNKASLFQTKELELEGDSVRIQQIFALISSLKIDWDGLLGSVIGDVPAHILGSSLRSGLRWSFNLSQSFLRDAEEFIKYELRLLPDKKRAEKQFSEIQSLAKKTDKLTTQMDLFEAKSL